VCINGRFHPGYLSSFFDWFTAIDDGLVKELARTDYYLNPLTHKWVTHDGMGIKLREACVQRQLERPFNCRCTGPHDVLKKP